MGSEVAFGANGGRLRADRLRSPVYVYRRGEVRIMLPIHVDDLLLASNSRDALQLVKTVLGAHFKLHDLVTCDLHSWDENRTRQHRSHH